MATWIQSTVPTLQNPMQQAGDIITGVAGGIPSRLPLGGSAQVLTSTGSAVEWAPNPAGFASPLTTIGDLIYGGTGGAAQRLPGKTNNSDPYCSIQSPTNFAPRSPPSKPQPLRYSPTPGWTQLNALNS